MEINTIKNASPPKYQMPLPHLITETSYTAGTGTVGTTTLRRSPDFPGYARLEAEDGSLAVIHQDVLSVAHALASPHLVT